MTLGECALHLSPDEDRVDDGSQDSEADFVIYHVAD